MKYLNILTAFFGEPWAIAEEKYRQIRSLLLLRARGEHVPPDQIEIAAAANRRASYSTVGRVAVIPIMGVIAPRVSLAEESSGGVGAETIGQQIDAAAADKQVGKIVLHIDSPGGSVFGVRELADKILKAREVKKIIAVADPVAQSAAYWIGSQATEFYVTPSGMVGSVGVIIEHADLSKAQEAEGIKTTLVTAGEYKAEWHPAAPLSDEAHAELQRIANSYYDMFTNAVAKGRGVTQAQVRESYGKGRSVLAADAKTAGMVDGVATLEAVLRRVAGETSRQAASARARAVEVS
jgi:signal peptide peptidase SppA